MTVLGCYRGLLTEIFFKAQELTEVRPRIRLAIQELQHRIDGSVVRRPQTGRRLVIG